MTEPDDPSRSPEPAADPVAPADPAPTQPTALYKPPQPLYQQQPYEQQPYQPPPYQPAQPYPAPQPYQQAQPQQAYEAPGTLGYTPETVHQQYAQPYAAQPYAGQPYAGQPYAGQQPNFGQPYPGYAGPPYPGQPYPGQPYSDAPVTTRRRRGRLIALAIVVVLAAAGVVAAVVSSGSGSGTSASKAPLPLPATFGTYTRLTDASADRFRSDMQTLFGSGSGSGASEIGKLFSASAVGAYAPSDAEAQQKLILIAGHAGDFPDLSPDQLSGAAFGPLGNPTSFPAGPHGGVVECVATNLSAFTETACVWSDKTSIGFAIGVDLPLSAKSLAADTNAARNTIDG